jgi:PHP family Zn ribbon phosphoesterase
MSYNAVLDALRKKDKKKFLSTIEFFPEEGKYHYDGHRLCNVRFSPQESKKNKNICPACGKPLTIGVMNRVAELADRPEGFVPENSIPYKRMIPLAEIIADVLDVGDASKAVDTEYRAIVPRLGTELEVLIEINEDKLLKELPVKIAKAIINVRNGNVNILPGFDGEYGTIEILKEKDAPGEKQMDLF